jgi:hypothetical protein
MAAFAGLALYIYFYQPCFFNSNHIKKGQPIKAVIIPTGNSIDNICLASRSQARRKIPPDHNESRYILFCPEGIKKRTMCGIINPTKPIIPA